MIFNLSILLNPG